MTCRCGHTEGPHPCHHCGGLDDCRERFYAAPVGSFSLSGMQAKASVRKAFLCAACHAHNQRAMGVPQPIQEVTQ